MSTETIETISLEHLVLDDRIQQRVDISQDIISDYAKLYGDGTDLGRLGPVVAFTCPELDTFVVVDGFHRVHAARKAGAVDIPVDVREGSFRDAVLFACGANKHGKQRTKQDLRKAISTMLIDDEWKDWANTKIAAHVGVTEKTVRNVRKELGVSSDGPKIVERNGQTFKMDTTKIGNKADASPTPQDASQSATEIESAADAVDRSNETIDTTPQEEQGGPRKPRGASPPPQEITPPANEALEYLKVWWQKATQAQEREFSLWAWEQLDDDDQTGFLLEIGAIPTTQDPRRTPTDRVIEAMQQVTGKTFTTGHITDLTRLDSRQVSTVVFQLKKHKRIKEVRRGEYSASKKGDV